MRSPPRRFSGRKSLPWKGLILLLIGLVYGGVELAKRGDHAELPGGRSGDRPRQVEAGPEGSGRGEAPEGAERAPSSPVRYSPDTRGGDMEVQTAFAEGISDIWVEVAGEVDRVLPDDREGSRHQRFILRLRTGQTLLISHNIDLAPRVPIRVGDRLEIRGEYEWNERGGLLHWTHRDPQRRHSGGWIRTPERTYR